MGIRVKTTVVSGHVWVRLNSSIPNVGSHKGSNKWVAEMSTKVVINQHKRRVLYRKEVIKI